MGVSETAVVLPWIPGFDSQRLLAVCHGVTGQDTIKSFGCDFLTINWGSIAFKLPCNPPPLWWVTHEQTVPGSLGLNICLVHTCSTQQDIVCVRLYIYLYSAFLSYWYLKHFTLIFIHTPPPMAELPCIWPCTLGQHRIQCPPKIPLWSAACAGLCGSTKIEPIV